MPVGVYFHKPRDQWVKDKISNSMKGKKPKNFELLRLKSPFIENHPQLNTGKTHFKKGQIPHNYKGGITKTKEYKRFYKSQYKHNKRNALGSHTFEQWENLKNLYLNICLCCKQQEPIITLTEDHIIPLSKGGSNNIENIQPLCRSCNSRKYTKEINFIERMTS